MDRIFAKLIYLMEKRLDTVLVTIIAEQGSTPRGTGSQMLVGSGGRILGTIGGGAVEARAEAMAKQLLNEKSSRVHLFQLHPEAAENIGMVCGGDVTVQYQFIPGDCPHWQALSGKLLDMTVGRQPGYLALRTDGSAPSLLDAQGCALLGRSVPGSLANGRWTADGSSGCFCMPLPIGERVVIFGGGHCAQALAPLLNTVGFRVTVFDERAEYACREKFPAAEQIIQGDYTDLSRYLQITADDYVVVMTNGHSFDLEVQDQVLRGDFAYLGVIGSRRKTAAVNQKLLERGVSLEAISRVHTPIGTPIKAVTPEEIAVSITGELIYTRALLREAGGIIPRGCPMH